MLWAEWAVAGLLLCLTIVGIPVGIQCFKIANLCIAPFKKDVVYNDIKFGSTLLNIVWLLIFGWEIAATALVCGIVWCITIVGIPFGKQFFKLAAISLLPFGAKTVKV